MKELKLKVAEAIQDDVNKGIIRIDSGYMQEIGARVGDIIELEGDRKTVGIADRAYPGDIGLNIIRMDGIIRKNARTGIGELVRVRKADVKEAKKIVIAPARKGIVIRAPPEIFKQGLLGRAVVKGDIVSLGGTRRRRTAMSESPFFDDVFNILSDENMMGFGFGDIKFIVADVSPKQAVIISEQSEVIFNPEAIEVAEERIPEVTYEDIGGLGDEIKKVREMVELPLKHPEIFERLGIEAPKGVLLHGPPGTGKTLLAKAVANETNSHFILINGPEIMSKYYGQSEENIRKKFEDAEKNAPSIIFIDEIDAIASKREETRGEVERRVVAQLLAMMDGLKSRGKVVVIAATNVPNTLDPALRRPGRFDREIEIGVPSKEGRLNILKIHTRNMPIDSNIEYYDKNLKTDKTKELISERITSIYVLDLLKTLTNAKDININELVTKYVKVTFQKIRKSLPDKFYSKLISILTDEITNLLPDDIKEAAVNPKTEKQLSEKLNGIKEKTEDFIRRIVREIILEEIAEKTYGFVGADLSSLAKESAMIVLRRVLPELKLMEDEPLNKEILEQLRITMSDFKEALKVVRPSALREVLIEVPNIKWTDIGGLEGVKQELKEAVEWPLKYPDAFKRLGVNPPKGILLYGAPGTGKTLLAKAVAHEAEANFISVKGPELLSKWVGESEKAVREIFKKARQTSPTIIFFDEIDSLAPRRGLSDNHSTERVVNQLLTEIDGVEEMHDVVIIGATNRPDILDTALLRPGRFDRIILVPVPDEKTRLEIVKVHTKGMPLKDVNLEELSKKTLGYVGSDIEAICREAAIFSLRENIKSGEVNNTHFELALVKVRPSVSKEIEQAYEELAEHFTSAKAKEMMEEKPAYMG